jgi:hypothetical protein
MVFLGSMIKTERMVKACVGRVSKSDSAWVDETYNSLGVNVGGILVVNPVKHNKTLFLLSKATCLHLHVVLEGNLSLLVADNGECELATRDLIDILDPPAMALNGVCRKADQLSSTLREFGLELRKRAQLGRAYWGVVFGMREQDDPAVTDELVEVDGAVCGFCVKVWGN